MLDSNYLLMVFLESVMNFCFSNYQVIKKQLSCHNAYFVEGIEFVNKIFTNEKKYLYWSRDCFVRLYITMLAIVVNIILSFFIL